MTPPDAHPGGRWRGVEASLPGAPSMRSLEGIRLALQQIRSHKLKSFFTLVGVIIGITFLIAVITIIEGMNTYIKEDFGGSITGVNTFTVQQRNTIQVGLQEDAELRRQRRNPQLRMQDVEVVRRAVPEAAWFAWASDRRISEVRYGQRSRKNIRVVGGSEEYEALQGWKVAVGRGLTPLDHRRGLKVAVIGAEIVDRLFPDVNPLAKRIRLAGQRLDVVGVFERQGGLLGNVRDATILIPYSTYNQTLAARRDEVEDIHVKVAEPADMEPAILAAEGALRADRGLRPYEESNFHIQTSSGLLSAWDTINRILLTALPGLVSISLVVGGIVIMNIMLLSVTERTREIGIRKAVGARRRDILFQFLAESSTLSLLGATLGILGGLGLARLVASLTPIPADVSGWSLALALALGMVVGVASGMYPAYRAARLDPIAALRFE